MSFVDKDGFLNIIQCTCISLFQMIQMLNTAPLCETLPSDVDTHVPLQNCFDLFSQEHEIKLTKVEKVQQHEDRETYRKILFI